MYLDIPCNNSKNTIRFNDLDSMSRILCISLKMCMYVAPAIIRVQHQEVVNKSL